MKYYYNYYKSKFPVAASNGTQDAEHWGQAYTDSSVSRCQLPVVKLSKSLEVLVKSLAASTGMVR